LRGKSDHRIRDELAGAVIRGAAGSVHLHALHGSRRTHDRPSGAGCARATDGEDRRVLERQEQIRALTTRALVRERGLDTSRLEVSMRPSEHQ
jgi:hypothetical protein